MAAPKNYSIEKKTEVFTTICNDVIEHKMSFNQAVKKSPINLVTFYKWLTENDSFKELYNYAREVRSDVLFEEIIEISDNTEEGVKEETKGKGRKKETKIIKGDMTDHRRLKIDSRKWVVSRMNPKKYGDKLDLTSDNDKLEFNVTIKKEQ